MPRPHKRDREYVPDWTDDHRMQVEAMSGYGLTQVQIAAIIGCTPKTLRKNFAEELEVGFAKATANVAKTLYGKAVGGDNACIIFWLKARAKWSTADEDETAKEQPQIALTITDSNPVDAAKSYAMLMGTAPTTLEHQPVQDGNGAEDETGMYRNIMEDETETVER